MLILVKQAEACYNSYVRKRPQLTEDNTGPIKLTSLLWTLSSKSRQNHCGALPQIWEQYAIKGRIVVQNGFRFLCDRKIDTALYDSCFATDWT